MTVTNFKSVVMYH